MLQQLLNCEANLVLIITLFEKLNVFETGQKMGW